MTDEKPNKKESDPTKEPVEVYPGVRRYQFFSRAKHRMLTPHLNRIAMLIIASSLLIVIVKALIIGSGNSLFCLEDRACLRVNKTDDPNKRCPEMLEPVEMVVASRVNDYIRFIKAGGLRCQGVGHCVEFCILSLDIPKIAADMQKRTLHAMELDKIPIDVLSNAFYDPRLGRRQTREEAANKDIFDQVQAYLEKRSSGAPQTEQEQKLALCLRCHAGADESLLSAPRYAHLDISELPPAQWTTRMVRIIRSIYLILIVLTTMGMLGHNILDFARTIRCRKTSEDNGASFDRFALLWRLQHVALAICFIYLAMSGLSMLFCLHWPAPAVVRLFGGVKWAALLHFSFGFFLIALVPIHILGIMFSNRFRRDMQGMFPRWRDVADVFRQMLFYLGLCGEGAKFGRFGYREKAEYWAAAWGIIIMGASGTIIFLGRAGAAVPAWLVLTARGIHGYEAILSVLAILVWHMYNAHLSPRRFPGSMTWLTGRISAREMADDHPLELEKQEVAKDAQK